MESPKQSIPGFFHTDTTYYKQILARARELALKNGRTSNIPSGNDLAQAREELFSQIGNLSETLHLSEVGQQPTTTTMVTAN